jgi:hypothetical protein
MTCCLTNQVLTHYTGESKTYYCDLGEAIKGRTVTGVTSIVSDDALLTLSGLAVISVDTSDYDQFGNPITIEANTGVSWTMSGGTAGSEDDEWTATIRITFTTAAGTEQAVVRVGVLDALP